MNRFVRCAVGLVAIAFSTALAIAQDLARPSGVRFASGDWTFVPVVKNVAGDWSSPGILALRKKDLVVGDNIVSIWYERPAVVGGAWAATSWVSQDQWQAITFVKNRFAIGSEHDFLWPTNDPVTAPASPETPLPYSHGLFVEDPLSALPNDANRDQVVTVLTELGYQSASVTLEQIGPCEGSVVLQGLSATAILAASTSPPASTLENFFLTGVPLSCAEIGVPSPPTGFVPGTNIPLPGAPLDPQNPWKRDDRPPVLLPDCTSQTTCCYAAPIIFRYVRKGANGLEYVEYCEGTQTWSCPQSPGVACPLTPSCSAPSAPLPDLDAGSVSCGLSMN